MKSYCVPKPSCHYVPGLPHDPTVMVIKNPKKIVSRCFGFYMMSLDLFLIVFCTLFVMGTVGTFLNRRNFVIMLL
jgi:hypothetical protein